MGAILIGFLYALLYCAIVVLIAFAFVWALRFIGVAIDGQVEKCGFSGSQLDQPIPDPGRFPSICKGC